MLSSVMGYFSEPGIDDCSEYTRLINAATLTPLFQPIVSFDTQKILGYESLIRGPVDSPYYAPYDLFAFATRCGQNQQLEWLCRELSIQQFQDKQLPGWLFLNATPQLLLEDHHDDKILESLQQHGLDPSRIVIELTENQPIDDYERMRESLMHYRSMGFSIAIDDFGSGYAGLRMWAEIRPNFIKIDRHFINKLDQDPVKQEFVRSMMAIAESIQCHVIAEGIETHEELAISASLGIGLGQGYHFCHPQDLPPASIAIDKFPLRTAKQQPIQRLSDTIASLTSCVMSVSTDTSVSDVADIFHSSHFLHTIPVIDDGHPQGIVRRSRFMDLFLSRYGRELHGKKPISHFMDPNPLVVEHNIPVETVSQMLTDTDHIDPEQDFIIIQNGHYMGMGRVMDLLKKITELQIKNASYANPLTLLPGNVPIDETINMRLQNHEPFTVAYCDLDNFKPYNDVHGYSKGDEVITFVAQLLEQHIDIQRDFLGHIGGDDFIIVFSSKDWESRCNAILQQFASKAPEFYYEVEREQGGIWSKNREGKASFFPLLSLSIGVTQPQAGSCHSHHQVAHIASEAKKHAKQTLGNSLFIDRREYQP